MTIPPIPHIFSAQQRRQPSTVNSVSANSPRTTLIACCCALALASGLANAASPLDQASLMVGEYQLHNSKNEPTSQNWRYTKAWLSVKKLDEKHFLFALGCAWAKEPKAACDEWFTLELRDKKLLVMDSGAPIVQIQFEANNRELTVISEGSDGTKRIDQYRASQSDAPTDSDLLRRLKRAKTSWKETTGPKYNIKYTYSNPVMTLGN